MSSPVAAKDLPEKPERDDPFRFGWRYVRRVGPDGKEVFDQVPLTLEDVLHPEEEDFRVHSDEHIEDCTYLRCVLKKYAPADAQVLTDHRVAWDDPEIRAHGPDNAVFLHVGARQRHGGTWDVAVEGVRPDLIIEVVSPDSRVNDVVTKMREYHQVGVRQYIIVDTEYRDGRRVRARLLGYLHTPDGYMPQEPNERGWLWLESVQLWLGIKGVQVVCYDATGQEIANYEGMAEARTEAEAEARKQAQARAEADAEARKQAQARAEADAEARKQARARADADAEARKQAQARADAEAETRKQAQARADAETRVRELEEELRRLRGQSPPPAPPEAS